MSDFILWNLIFAIAWGVWRCLKFVLPTSTTFAILSTGRSAIHGPIGRVLIDEQEWTVVRTGNLWRYQKDNRVVPVEWADLLDENLNQ